MTRDQLAVYVARSLTGGIGKVPTYSAQATFPDVPADYWAFNEIEYCYARNLVYGYGDGYHPLDAVDRSQMAVFVARAVAGGDQALNSFVPPTNATFPDVPPTFWAYKYVEYCYAQGIVQGGTDGNYHPNELVTRAQMAVYIARAFGYTMQ